MLVETARLRHPPKVQTDRILYLVRLPAQAVAVAVDWFPLLQTRKPVQVAVQVAAVRTAVPEVLVIRLPPHRPKERRAEAVQILVHFFVEAVEAVRLLLEGTQLAQSLETVAMVQPQVFPVRLLLTQVAVAVDVIPADQPVQVVQVAVQAAVLG